MTTSLFDDLRMAEENPSAFPREFATASLVVIAQDEEIDWRLRNQAQRELTIREHGIQIYGIFPTEDDDGVGFSYSVGASRVGLPEMLSFYPSYKTNHWVMNRIYQLMLDLKIELPTVEGEIVKVKGILLDDLEVALVMLNKEQREEAYEEYTCQVESAEVPILHVVLPTPAGDWLTDYIPKPFKVEV